MSPPRAEPDVAWRFRSPFAPEILRERLAASVGGPDETTTGALLGRVGLDWARIYRRPREGRAPLPLRIDWIVDGDGAAVTCRMRQPDKGVMRAAYVGLALMFAVSVYFLLGPIAAEAGGLTAAHVIVFVLWSLFLGWMGLFYGVAVRSTYRDERLLLIAHAQQALKGGAVEAVRA
ncbi:hypothetical protein G5B46_05545 [Caulobacter sp. 602-2]|uniref:Uncharacterized protein n=1 Tax=Caulobacter sp. 602-2 TaxID=2710887 RepID=A0A6G4QTT8_9CAUL|nr:hypothetical protein [Caulobacter sp. 602-2]NGM49066.1 hypothetical protein [Caulobacter sp. 602-2]